MNAKLLLPDQAMTAPLTVHSHGETPWWLAPLDLHSSIRQDLLRGLHGSEFASSNRSSPPWLGVSAGSKIKNLSLTLEDTAESANKDSLLPEKIVLLIGQSLLSFNWRRKCLCCGQLPPAALGLILLGKLRLSYIRPLNKLLGWRKSVLRWAFLWLMWFDWLWS